MYADIQKGMWIMAFEWKDRYKLNIEEIDKQHQKLFEIGARVYDLTRLDSAYDRYDEIMEVIQELLDYTQYHFKYEEELLEKYKYQHLATHIKEHNYFVGKIKSLLSRDIDEAQMETLQDIVDFLSEWISTHIMFEDRKYTEVVKAG